MELGEYLGPLLNNLAMLHTQLGRFEDAERLFEEAFDNALQAGAAYTQVAVQVNRVDLWITQGDLSRAMEACDAAFGLAQRLGASRWLAEIHKYYGTLERETGNHRRALEELRRAEALAREAEDHLLTAETLRERAEVHWCEGQHRETLECLLAAYRLFFELRAGPDLADVDRQLNRLENRFSEIVLQWGESIESKDRYTHGHCKRVAELGCALARATGMDEKVLVWFRMGAFLHDVGKVAIPSEILNKPGPLTQSERSVIEGHAEEGDRLLANIEFPWDIRPMVRHHHEHWAGTGYPDGLTGDEIPLPARVLCIADVYDALTSERSYRMAHSPRRALSLMEEGAGTVFDPGLFRTFKGLVQEGKIEPGTRVRLKPVQGRRSGEERWLNQASPVFPYRTPLVRFAPMS